MLRIRYEQSDTESRSTSLPNVVKWQLVQTVFSGEGLISSVKEVACFWIVVETWVVALSVSPFNNFAVTVFSVLATEMACRIHGLL